VSGELRNAAKTPKDAAVQIGARLRAARQARSLTLGQVAAAAGLTEGFVSKLERDQVSPSVASLVAVCEAIGLRVGDLFEPPATNIVRAGNGPLVNFGGKGARESLLSPGGQTYVEVLHSLVEPGGNGGAELYALDCELEFIYVIAGSFEIQIGPKTYLLNAGDSMSFKGKEPHTWRNPSASDGAEVIWVLAPAP
jgi:transcriptional regulator with XRE-family HTH domain